VVCYVIISNNKLGFHFPASTSLERIDFSKNPFQQAYTIAKASVVITKAIPSVDAITELTKLYPQQCFRLLSYKQIFTSAESIAFKAVTWGKLWVQSDESCWSFGFNLAGISHPAYRMPQRWQAKANDPVWVMEFGW